MALHARLLSLCAEVRERPPTSSDAVASIDAARQLLALLSSPTPSASDEKLLSVPPELIVRILAFLEDANDLAMARRCCRAFADLVSEALVMRLEHDCSPERDPLGLVRIGQLVGRRVAIHGLRKRPEFNGATGSVLEHRCNVSHAADSGRFLVRPEGGPELLLRAENMRALGKASVGEMLFADAQRTRQRSPPRVAIGPHHAVLIDRGSGRLVTCGDGECDASLLGRSSGHAEETGEAVASDDVASDDVASDDVASDDVASDDVASDDVSSDDAAGHAALHPVHNGGPKIARYHTVACAPSLTLIVTTSGQLYMRRRTHDAACPGLLQRVVGPLAQRVVCSVAAGVLHLLALTADGGVYSWGAGHDGALGHGDQVGRSQRPLCLDECSTCP